MDSYLAGQIGCLREVGTVQQEVRSDGCVCVDEA